MFPLQHRCLLGGKYVIYTGVINVEPKLWVELYSYVISGSSYVEVMVINTNLNGINIKE